MGAGRITDIQARAIRPGGKPLTDSGEQGLRLEPGARPGRAKWVFRFTSPITGRRRDMGLGVYPTVAIAEARTRVRSAREVVAAGRDPVDDRKAKATAVRSAAAPMTFEKAAGSVHADRRAGWKNGKHQDQWINTLATYAFPRIGARSVADLAPADFAEVLRPIWLSKPETASRVKQRCHAVLRWCWAQGLVSANPLDVVDLLLPRQPGKRERVVHHAALPWRDVPGLWSGVLAGGGTTRALIRFILLTAARSGEARAATWDEIDLAGRTWTVPASRMKAGREHRVPLSPEAVELLKALPSRPEGGLVFRAPRGGALSDMTLTMLFRRHGVPSTVHGLRSSFRDWASEHGWSRDLAERALAHIVASATEAAYHRTDLLDQRRPMMEAWAKHATGVGIAGNVVRLT